MATADADGLGRPDQVILRVLAGVGRPTASTKLVKLVYLVDYTYYQHYGTTLTGLQYQWDHFGPNAEGHAIIGHADDLACSDLVDKTVWPNYYGSTTVGYRFIASAESPSLNSAGEMIVDDIIAQYGGLSVQAITRASKRTAPFDKATQYSPLHMEHAIPALSTEREDWNAHLIEVKEEGTVSLEELMEEYGLA